MNWYIHVLKNYANFNGRARRKEYWMFLLIHLITYFSLAIIQTVSILNNGPTLLFSLLTAIYLIGIIIPSIAVAVRRMHDVGKSGWYILIPVYSLVLAVTGGDSGPNNYGKDPKGNSQDIEEIGQPLQ
ncbi:MAG: DUF805 domain-containing protein [Bacteroidetes bacterium MedPE-SWsnd-G2]|nr:MAG: DUF805 domain-containing protein [Bacteroidetes bacterium MedPE-SWsnd-G2]